MIPKTVKERDNRLTLDDILAIKYPEGVEWSPDGRRISFLWEDGGVKDLWTILVRQNRLERLTDSGGVISSPDWSPDCKSILFTQDGDIWKAEVKTGNEVRLTKTKGEEDIPKWAPDGSRFCFARGGDIWVYSFKDHSIAQLSVPGEVAVLTESGKILAWSPDGEKIAFVFVKKNRMRVGVVSTKSGEVIWKTNSAHDESMPIWLPDGDNLIYRRTFNGNLVRQHLLVNLKDTTEELLIEEKDSKGLPFREPPALSPDGSKLVFILREDGWDHLWLKSLKDGGLTQLTKGEHEDIGHGSDSPSWSPDGERIAFSSNRGSLGERQLWTISLKGELEKVTSIPGTNVSPKWSPGGESIAFIHSGPYESIDVWIVNLNKKGEPIQLTKSMPKSFTKQNMVVPKEVVYKSAEDWDIHAYLFKPKNMVAGKKYPAIVWVHGGPIRQMRYGWHPFRAYSTFDAFHQYLLQKGYVVLSVNFRGGIGYGKEYEQGNYLSMGVNDCLDVVNGARYLKSLDFVNPERIGVWGISYGGYMVLHALTKHPDVFRLGINFAGIINFESWMRWAEKNYREAAEFFKARLGGEPEDNPEAYYKASPINFVENMKSPLFSFHGTEDKAVTFKQLDEIVTAMVENEKYFEANHYPGEEHAFRSRKTWKDAFAKAEKYFNEYLKK